MNTNKRERISKRTVDAALAGERKYIVWDIDLKGFGVRIMPSAVKTYFIAYRAAGGGRGAPQREYTIGRHGQITAEQARTEAAKLLGSVRFGADPAADRTSSRAELSVSELCDLYLAEGVATKKASTLVNDRQRIARHIKPLIGRKRVSAVSSGDIERLQQDIATGKTAVRVTKERKRTDPAATGGKGAASRTVGQLGAIFAFAVKRGLRSDNPVIGVKRYKDGQSHRFLSTDEMGKLGTALLNSTANTMGRDIIRLLILTGARKGEIEQLRWSEVDFQRSCLLLADSKTGAKAVPVGAAVLELLQAVKRTVGSPFVFPSETDPTKHFVGTPKVWRQVRAAAGLHEVRLHDLRHSYASAAAAGGLSLQLIGRLLGHQNVKTTAQYAHLANDPVMQAAERTSTVVAAALSGHSAEVITLKKA
ncbi:tyrosine-type recombinase/integrase [Maricaulis sp.]|uniref:tyrosine-type recombinase/integrase n=1 Tax=Maricaulis sp. TaxID=1486257 RepID=UPI003A936D38